MVGMEMGDKKILDLFDRNPFAFELGHKFRKRSRPAAIDHELARCVFDQVIICRVVANVDDVHRNSISFFLLTLQLRSTLPQVLNDFNLH